MTELTLYIANKNYSSWSFRPWIALTATDIAFNEVLVPFDDDAKNPKFREFSPTGRVPVLQHEDVTIWESLAIIEYAADLYPEAGLWPDDAGQRGIARAMCCEMLSGFSALRGRCPMNLRRPHGGIGDNPAVAADVHRIEAIWASALEASGGPFLFGRFSAADAMFAPVVNRLDVYQLTETPKTLAYMNTVKGLPAWQAWEKAARAEPWTVPADEA